MSKILLDYNMPVEFRGPDWNTIPWKTLTTMANQQKAFDKTDKHFDYRKKEMKAKLKRTSK